jgi:mannose-6-phosphate isomerase-like protein (cupin superfamily)
LKAESASPRVVRNRTTREYYFREGCHITEWLNSADDENLSIARARVEPGVTTRLHSLAGITERYLILEGRGQVRVGQLPEAEVEPGDVVVIPPDQPQQITNSGSDDLIFLAICTPRFKPEFYADLEQSDSG